MYENDPPSGYMARIFFISSWLLNAISLRWHRKIIAFGGPRYANFIDYQSSIKERREKMHIIRDNVCHIYIRTSINFSLKILRNIDNIKYR